MQKLVIGGGIGGLTAAIALSGKGPPVDNAVATHEMFELVAKPI